MRIKGYSAAALKILIGFNNVEITISSKIKAGRIEEPVDIKTPLGWTVFGPCGNKQLRPYNLHICE